VQSPYVLAVSTCLIAALAAAQAPQPTPVASEPAEKPPAAEAPASQIGGLRFVDVAEVTIVNVDVGVTDKNGPVVGLTKDDFEVFQDGKAQELTNFYLFTRSGAAPEAVVTPSAVPALPQPAQTPAFEPPPREPRFLVIYVDNENITPFNRNRVLNKTNEFLRSFLRPPDKAMVVSYQRSLKVQQPFTSDPEECVEALRLLRTYTGGRTEVDSSRRQIEDGINNYADKGGSMEQALGDARGFAREGRNNLMFTVGAIKELIGMMSGLPGKKSVIYVSDGLPMRPGLELFYGIQEKYSDPGVISQTMDFDATDLFRSLVTTANASGVTFYTIDARGLEAELGSEAENRVARSTLAASVARTNYQDSLVYMAQQTGGMAIINSNDVASGLEKIANDLQTYYSLGYRLVPSGQDRSHVVSVKVKGHPEYRLTYQKRFIEKSLATRIGDRVMSGLSFDLEDNPLGIEIRTGEPMPASAGRWLLPVEISVPIEKVALIPDGKELVGYVMAYYAARDDEGKQSDLQRTEAALRIPEAEYERAKLGTYTISANLLLDPGMYRISVGVRDQLTNQAGYATVRRPVHPEEKTK
jgi:VWFA-related protein